MAGGLLLAAVAFCPAVGRVRAQSVRPAYLDPERPVDARVEDLLARMTLEEKLSLLHADSKFSTAAVPRLGVPRRWLSDGPHGVREEVGPDDWKPAGRTDDFATYMPALIALASTWNPELGRLYGEVIGREGRRRGKQVMLGPGMNIMRTPLNGRNFEYFGEDPFLTSRMAVAYIRGAQSEGVASCAKHFVGNDQEWKRSTINVVMDERTLREIYLPPFRAAVQEAGVLTVMSAYNKFRGVYSSENDYLINKILKGEWGFKGPVMSDWNGMHSTNGAVRGGLDLEMGTDNRAYKDFYLAGPFAAGLRSGLYPLSLLDDKARRNLRQMFAAGVFDGREPGGALNTKEHQAAARRVAEEGVVLLKNEGGALPLDPNKVRSVAVIGENAVRLHAYGGGSAGVKAFYEVTPLEGIVRRAGDRADVSFSTGYRAEGDREELMERAVRAAGRADVTVVVGGLNHDKFLDAESADRKDLKLPYGQDELIRRRIAREVFAPPEVLAGGKWSDETVFSQLVMRLTADNQIEGLAALRPAFIKRDEVGWVGTHRHAPGGDEPYIFCNLFKYRLDLPEGAKTLTLPKNSRVRIVAISAAKNFNDVTTPAHLLYE